MNRNRFTRNAKNGCHKFLSWKTVFDHYYGCLIIDSGQQSVTMSVFKLLWNLIWNMDPDSMTCGREVLEAGILFLQTMQSSLKTCQGFILLSCWFSFDSRLYRKIKWVNSSRFLNKTLTYLFLIFFSLICRRTSSQNRVSLTFSSRTICLICQKWLTSPAFIGITLMMWQDSQSWQCLRLSLIWIPRSLQVIFKNFVLVSRLSCSR